MSVQVMSWVWNHSPYEGTKLLVHLALADWSDDYGRCFPGVERIAEKARCKKRNAQTILRQMEADGQISVDFMHGAKTSTGYTNRYNLVAYQMAKGVQSNAPLNDRDAAQCTPGVQPNAPLGVQPNAPKPSVDPSVDPSVKKTGSRARKTNKPIEPVVVEEPPVDALRVKYGSIFSLYENAIGMITEIIKSDLIEAAETYPDDWITEAFKLAVTNNKRRWSYVNRILMNWKDHGRDYKPWTEKKQKPSANGSAPKPTTAPAPEPVEEMDPALRYPSQMFARIRKQLEAEGVKVP